MKKIFILFFSCVVLGACTNEKEAQELYQKATQQKQIKNYQTAIQIYKQIAEQYPRSSVISSVLNEMAFCEKEFTKQKIEHNTPIILKAVDEFPAAGIMLKIKGFGIMPLGKSIAAYNEFICKTAKNTVRKTRNSIYSSYEDILAAKYLADIFCSHRVGKWQVNSTDNESYMVSKIDSGLSLEGKNFERTIAYVINLSQSTITAIDENSCPYLSWEKNIELFKKRAQKMTVDYKKECSLPIKLEGVLK